MLAKEQGPVDVHLTKYVGHLNVNPKTLVFGSEKKFRPCSLKSNTRFLFLQFFVHAHFYTL